MSKQIKPFLTYEQQINLLMDTKGLIIRDKDTATHLLPNEDFLAFKRNMGKLINNTIKRSSNISEQKLLGAMGFPNNWSKITGYKK